jgi:TrmH family RNA methyltransferase
MIQFILNKPRNPKNIGAAARGMANFGFRELAVVAPYSVAWRETRSAVQAGPVVKKAKKYKTLQSAVAKSHLVVGTSAGSRRKLDETWVLLDDLPALVHESIKANQNISIVFGSEKYGLSNEDLGHCHVIVKIPTVPDCPSMNLAQAVAVVAHTLRDTTKITKPRAGKAESISTDNREILIRRCMNAFQKAGLLHGWNLSRTEERIRRSFNKWSLTKTDAALMHRIFRWVLQQSLSR